jgi:GNAT superfamily N-acetyltransferase
MIVEPLSVRTLDAWAALFDACGSGCFCRYWHFEGDKNAWLARCAESPDENRREQDIAVRARDPGGHGLVAMAGSACVGWMKLAPRAAVPKLRRLPVYHALDLGPDEGVWSIACFLVHPSRRRAGVARALLAAADAHVRAAGGTALEAYPRRAGHALHDEEAWLGPLALYEELGYRAIAGEGPYPVMRKSL